MELTKNANVYCILEWFEICFLKYINWLYHLQKSKTSPPAPKRCSNTKLNLIVIGVLRNVEYYLIAITSRSTLSSSGSTCLGPIDLFKNYFYSIGLCVKKISLETTA